MGLLDEVDNSAGILLFNAIEIKLITLTFFLWILGARSFNRRSLHHLGDTPNPYGQEISIIGRNLSAFDEEKLIPCFGFGDGKF